MVKAREFLGSATELQELHGEDAALDSVVSLLVLAGIAAADVVCCARTGHHPQGQNHDEAVKALEKCDRGSEKHLARLLRLKTASGYGSTVTSRSDAVAALRAAETLVGRAEELS